MAKQPAKKSVSATGLKKRAFCKTEQKFVGEWHDKDSDVYDDIDAHKGIAGNAGHIVKVIDQEA